MYTYNTRVGFSQVDTNRLIKMEALTNLFQDVTCFQGEEIGNGFDYLEPKHQAWILNSWQVDVKRFPEFNEEITVGTFPTSFKGFLGNRNFVVKDKTGEIIVMANSIWTFMDMEKMRPTKVEEEFISRYTLEEPLPMDYSARKIMVPKDDEVFEAESDKSWIQTEERREKQEAADGSELWLVSKKEPFKVREYYLDSNMHVNNGQYVQIASGFLPQGIKYNRMRVEYRNQARLGDRIVPIIYKKENACIVALCDNEKKPYAVVECSVTI